MMKRLTLALTLTACTTMHVPYAVPPSPEAGGCPSLQAPGGAVTAAHCLELDKLPDTAHVVCTPGTVAVGMRVRVALYDRAAHRWRYPRATVVGDASVGPARRYVLDLPAYSGDSGSPVYDTEGRCLGVIIHGGSEWSEMSPL
jgi:hypothetical protein